MAYTCAGVLLILFLETLIILLLLLLFAGGSGCAHSCPLIVYFIVLYRWELHPQPLDFRSQIPVPVILSLKITEAMLCDSFCHFVELMGEGNQGHGHSKAWLG